MPKLTRGDNIISFEYTLVKNAAQRDAITTWLRKENVDPLCFDVEAAGLMNAFPCTVIKASLKGRAKVCKTWQCNYSPIMSGTQGEGASMIRISHGKRN